MIALVKQRRRPLPLPRLPSRRPVLRPRPRTTLADRPHRRAQPAHPVPPAPPHQATTRLARAPRRRRHRHLDRPHRPGPHHLGHRRTPHRCPPCPRGCLRRGSAGRSRGTATPMRTADGYASRDPERESEFEDEVLPGRPMRRPAPASRPRHARAPCRRRHLRRPHPAPFALSSAGEVGGGDGGGKVLEREVEPAVRVAHPPDSCSIALTLGVTEYPSQATPRGRSMPGSWASASRPGGRGRRRVWSASMAEVVRTPQWGRSRCRCRRRRAAQSTRTVSDPVHAPSSTRRSGRLVGGSGGPGSDVVEIAEPGVG